MMRIWFCWVVFLLLSLMGCSDEDPSQDLSDSTDILSFGGGGGGGTPFSEPDISSTNEDSISQGDILWDTSVSDVEIQDVFEDINGDDIFSDALPGEDAADDSSVWEIDISEVECLYVPQPEAFAPVQECYWADPKQKVNYNDVVMTPVVVNLTDDDGDGDVDLEDTPDIAFLTYRYEEDGCCNENAVLRVVSGSCSGGGTHLAEPNPLLHEHFYVASPYFDNSGGLSVGDIDNDGLVDIVGVRPGPGTIAMTGVIYTETAPHFLDPESSGWAPSGAPDPLSAVLEEIPDEDTFIISESSGDFVQYDWDWSQTSAAIASLRIVAHVKSPTAYGKLSGYLTLNGEMVAADETVYVDSDQDFERVVFSFLKNPFEDENQWTDTDVSTATIGLLNSHDSELHITRIALEVGNVNVKWESEYPLKEDIVTASQPAIADLNQDGAAEIVIGRTVLDGATGTLLWKGPANGGTGTNAFMGPISIAADINLDGFQEVIAGNTLYDHEGNILWQYVYGNEGTGCQEQSLACDGYNATGNFDEDSEGEIVIVRTGVVYVLEHTGELLAMIPIPHDNCTFNEGGPPTVADFDADGQPEIGVAGADYYAVFDLECCSDLPGCTGYPATAPQCVAPGIRWQVPNEDCSSRVTGSSVFDFDGDGAAEVVYNDEVKFRIFNGSTGEVLVEEENHSHTRLEYPIIADTDRDGNAEIVFIENGYQTGDPTPIQVWGDASDNWVPTRRIWNQHAYNITGITEEGLLPPGGETPNWLSFNNFRQNLPDFDPFLAPDLMIVLTDTDLSQCPEQVTLQAKVCNGGQLFVSGVSVRFLNPLTGEEVFCEGGVDVPNVLNAGECALARCVWVGEFPEGSAQMEVCVDNYEADCGGPGWNNECDETNNLSGKSLAFCPE